MKSSWEEFKKQRKQFAKLPLRSLKLSELLFYASFSLSAWMAILVYAAASLAGWTSMLTMPSVVKTSVVSVFFTSVLTILTVGMIFILFAFYVPLLKYEIGHHRNINKECWYCGYDLTGNTSGVCPECGTSTETP